MALASERMARLGELLDQSLSLGQAGRRAWFEVLTGEDRQLMQGLRDSLLAEDPSTMISGPLDQPPRIHGAVALEEAITRQVGERLGAYELLRPLGSGGMAEVWLARRSDGAFEREVALKIPRLRGNSAEIAERFARECRILASLEYPGIARLYDAGVDGSGVPYVAMEYVQGEPLVAWCDARKLEVPARIRIFLQVLDAVAHAHGHHVLHRDLKPSNILVTGQSEVRLLDFGVARLLQGDTAGPLVTQTWGPALTPGYASPELLRGEPVDLRSDIYSLGVVLHELLTGVRPRETVPATQALRGALRGIVKKALAPVPADRYADIASLTQALRQFVMHPPGRLPGRRFTGFLAAGIAVPVLAGGVLLWNRPDAAKPVATALPATIGTAPGAPPVSIDADAPAPSGAGSIKSLGEPKPVAVPPAPVAAVTIAVLPFTNFTEDPELEDVADGLMLQLADRLAEIPGLEVRGRASNFSLKDRHEDSGRAARALGVSRMVEGNLHSEGGRLQATVQLVDVQDGRRLWSSRPYEIGSGASGLLVVMERIALDIVKALSLKVDMSTAGSNALRTASDDAGRGYLKWRKLRLEDRGGLEITEEGIALLSEVVKHDDGFVLAWDALSSLQRRLAKIRFDEGKPGEAKRLEAEAELARGRVYELAGPDNWIMLRGRSDAALRVEKWADALAYARQVRNSGPPALERMVPLMNVLFAMGYLKETIDLQEDVIKLESQSLWMSREQQWNLYAAGRLRESQEEYERSQVLEGNRSDLEHVARLRMLADRNTDPEVLRAAYSKVLTQASPPWFRDYVAAIPDRTRMLEILKAAFEQGEKIDYKVADALGDAELAMAALRQAWPVLRYQTDGYWQLWLMPHSGVRSHPQFKALLREIGLYDYWRESRRWPDFCHALGENDFECV